MQKRQLLSNKAMVWQIRRCTQKSPLASCLHISVCSRIFLLRHYEKKWYRWIWKIPAYYLVKILQSLIEKWQYENCSVPRKISILYKLYDYIILSIFTCFKIIFYSINKFIIILKQMCLKAYTLKFIEQILRSFQIIKSNNVSRIVCITSSLAK